MHMAMAAAASPMEWLLALEPLAAAEGRPGADRLAGCAVSHFRGAQQAELTYSPRMYGGQLLGQALIAAALTVDGAKRPHSCTGFFLKGGKVQGLPPIEYAVVHTRDGGTFSTRRVLASQGEGAARVVLFELIASFQVEEKGLEHAEPGPRVRKLEECESQQQFFARYAQDPRIPEQVRAYLSFRAEKPPVWDVRYTETRDRVIVQPREARQSIWIKCADRLPANMALHYAALAFISDFTMLDTSLLPHGQRPYLPAPSPDLQETTLAHTVYFHKASFRADGAVLHDMTSHAASGARGLVTGRMYDEAGALLASTVQEGLIRVTEGGLFKGFNIDKKARAELLEAKL